jgi:hypothetical protein
MPLTKTQKNLLVAGGLIAIGGGVTAYAIAKALAKPPTKRYRCTGPPDYKCVEDPNGPYTSIEECQAYCTPTPPTYPPSSIEFTNLPLTIEQYYHCVLSGPVPLSQHLDDIKPYVNQECTQEGWVGKTVYGRVLDAMGRGVPNIAVDVWCSPTPDIYNGSLFLNGATRTADSPLRLVTDTNGNFAFSTAYLTAMSYLAEKGCRACTPIGCDVAKPCTTIYPIYAMWFTCGYRTPGYVYQLTAKVKGTVLSTVGMVTAYANLVG